MTAPRHLFAYQPILNANRSQVAVELIYRSQDHSEDNNRIVANAILNAFVHTGAEALAQRRPTHLAAPQQLLESELLDQLPADRFVLEVSPQDAMVLEDRCRRLQQAGFRIALDGVGSDLDLLRRLLAWVDLVRLDGNAVLRGEIELMGDLRSCGVPMLASAVDQETMVEQLRPLGFSLFQGLYFAHPANQLVPRADPRKMAVLKLLAKLASDEDDPVIEDAFKVDPALSLNLLRLVNSPAFAMTTRIRSIKHAFSILGRKQLERWLQVLLFAFDGDGEASPLMELALRRSRFMEFVLIYRTHRGSTELQSEAYMAGLLSLADVLLGWTMGETVARLNPTDNVRSALLDRSGPLGKLINLCELLEAADFEAAMSVAETLNLPFEAVMTAQNVALAYAEEVGNFSVSADDEAQGPDTAA